MLNAQQCSVVFLKGEVGSERSFIYFFFNRTNKLNQTRVYNTARQFLRDFERFSKSDVVWSPFVLHLEQAMDKRMRCEDQRGGERNKGVKDVTGGEVMQGLVINRRL